MPITTRVHAILTEAGQLAIVNALSFYNDWHTTDLPYDKDNQEQYLAAFREGNRGRAWNGPIDQLATRIANLK
jgi:hypothetical protein